jgi:dTDP-4-dehydrorhamnose 3,5-epimerase
MIFEELELQGAYVISLERLEDNRGFFARTFCTREFSKHKLNTQIVQSNLSYSRRKGTLRGMHWQIRPCQETKLISCYRGKIYDVIVDLRPTSPTYTRWIAVELTDDDYKMIYVPKGFAHGFQTLKDDSLLCYQVSEFYSPDYERGARWNDPAFGIRWPMTPPTVLSNKDGAYSNFTNEINRA